MEGPGVFPWLPFLLFVGLKSASAQSEPVYTAVNGTIRLKPESSGPFTNIVWKHTGNLVVEWANNDFDYYGMFRNHTTLDTTTGRLEIRDTDETFAGLYTVETNSQVQLKGYIVEFIKEVPKPDITVRPLTCSTDQNNDCTLVCGHDEGSGLGPLSYSWREGAGKWQDGDKNKMIMKDETNSIQNFTCRVRNPISVAESEAHSNPFYVQNLGSSAGAIVGGILVLVALLGGGLGFFAWKKGKLDRCLHPTPGGDPPANRNGAAGNQSPTEGEPLKKDPETPNAANTEP